MYLHGKDINSSLNGKIVFSLWLMCITYSFKLPMIPVTSCQSAIRHDVYNTVNTDLGHPEAARSRRHHGHCWPPHPPPPSSLRPCDNTNTFESYLRSFTQRVHSVQFTDQHVPLKYSGHILVTRKTHCKHVVVKQSQWSRTTGSLPYTLQPNTEVEEAGRRGGAKGSPVTALTGIIAKGRHNKQEPNFRYRSAPEAWLVSVQRFQHDCLGLHLEMKGRQVSEVIAVDINKLMRAFYFDMLTPDGFLFFSMREKLFYSMRCQCVALYSLPNILTPPNHFKEKVNPESSILPPSSIHRAGLSYLPLQKTPKILAVTKVFPADSPQTKPGTASSQKLQRKAARGRPFVHTYGTAWD